MNTQLAVNPATEAKRLTTMTMHALAEGNLVQAVLEGLPAGCKVWMGRNEDLMVDIPIEPLARRRNRGSHQDSFTKLRFAVKATRGNVRAFLVALAETELEPGVDLETWQRSSAKLQKSQQKFHGVGFTPTLA